MAKVTSSSFAGPVAAGPVGSLGYHEGYRSPTAWQLRGWSNAVGFAVHDALPLH